MQTSYYRLISDAHPGAICISRRMPRGTNYPLYPALAPGSWFNSVSIAQYVELYQAILNKLDPQKVWDELHSLTDAEPILLCYEVIPKALHDTKAIELPDKNFCHRRLVAEWFEQELGVQVLEFVREKRSLVIEGDQLGLF